MFKAATTTRASPMCRVVVVQDGLSTTSGRTVLDKHVILIGLPGQTSQCSSVENCDAPIIKASVEGEDAIQKGVHMA
jgi:hypothetical protein